MRSKRVLKITACMFIILGVVAGCVFFFVCSTRLPEGKIVFSGDAVDNEYNNCISGQSLVRIGDTLYYDYFRYNASVSGLNYGLISIDQNAAERVYWDGLKGIACSYPVRNVNGRLVTALKGHVDDSKVIYSPETDTFDDFEEVQTPSRFRFFCRDGEFIYETYDGDGYYEPKENSRICRDYDGKTEVLLSADDISNWYVSEDCLYYVCMSPTGDGESVLKKYSYKDKADEYIAKLGDFNVYNLMVEGQYVVFTTGLEDYTLYKLNLADEKPVPEAIYQDSTMSGSLSPNVYDGKLYVACGYGGLLCFDLQSDNMCCLYEGYVAECDIFDEEWVYFVGDKGVLRRVTKDGKTVEKIFG